MTIKPFPMMTKACTNGKCRAYAHFVFTVAMRCVLCRCDLKSAQRISESTSDGLHNKSASENVVSRHPARAHAAR
ncbi:MAG: hypothetical protein WBV55_15395 [Candidatus Sulfotelmatobacter sp.]